ncbi:hypothetical protein CKO25_10555 [Thiocapsa imhoffii]|uniref:Uncharacterized protein n=1 Tax=Thiocapsa imhoffii TaxID=382777 RepID=A0A9X0WIF6_9GAMM|nr:hypothetical protein [Thiocapsa imhoffii]MBK1645085.1 hypothetical protein [Thiocapsa imhoffii]
MLTRAESVQGLKDLRQHLWERWWLPHADTLARTRLEKLHAQGAMPRIALVKQDCNEDLYCCTRGTPLAEMLRSTLLRSGPVALFTQFRTQFVLVRAEEDPECAIWKEKARDLRWCPEEWFRSFQDRVPGRDYGQTEFAVSVEDVDWSAFDLVISVDVAVPARITRRFPQVVWAYYVREVKAPSYRVSLQTLLPGQDLFLKQNFAPRFRRGNAAHVVDFPYHFHYHGVFLDAFQEDASLWCGDADKAGIFLEHHMRAALSDKELTVLERFGPVYSTHHAAVRHDEVAGKAVPVTTMEPEVLAQLHAARYFVKMGGRNVFGTAMVEAIACGAVALGDPHRLSHRFLYSRVLSAESFAALVDRLERLEAEPTLLAAARARQRALVDHLCFRRPALELVDACQKVRARRH